MYVSLSWGNPKSDHFVFQRLNRNNKGKNASSIRKRSQTNKKALQCGTLTNLQKLVSKGRATGRHFTGLSESGFSNLLLSCTCCYLFDWGILPCQHSQDLGKVLCKDSWNTMKCQRWQVAEISCAKIAATGLLDLLLLFSSPLDCFWHLDSVVKSVCGSKYFMPHSPAKEQRCHI